MIITKEIQVGDVIEEFNCTGSSDRVTTHSYTITDVTKTLAKSNGFRFKRTAEQWNVGCEYSVKHR